MSVGYDRMWNSLKRQLEECRKHDGHSDGFVWGLEYAISLMEAIEESVANDDFDDGKDDRK